MKRMVERCPGEAALVLRQGGKVPKTDVRNAQLLLHVRIFDRTGVKLK
jgi:hypothetical protein